MPLKLGHYSAYIQCYGKEPEMFEVALEDEKTMSCWIPSEEGKAFSVHWEDDIVRKRMQVSPLMDGHRIVCTAHSRQNRGQCSAVQQTAKHACPFVPLVLSLSMLKLQYPFLSNISHSVDDESLTNTKAHPELGTIRMEMTRVRSSALRFSYWS
ncbi:hypothetical protein BC628DRAFT_1369561 [Trametes gibbosa]|nr:hypothetical protein BC628DRAFT_1369561 [Trametes gibbosa]